MRASLVRLADSLSASQRHLWEASSMLLPPIPLYRQILRRHRYLPKEMRSLGDEYVKAEFRRHRDITNPVHLMGFLCQWKTYLDELPHGPNGEKFTGNKLEQAVIEKMSEEQIGQLYELMKSIKSA